MRVSTIQKLKNLRSNTKQRLLDWRIKRLCESGKNRITNETASLISKTDGFCSVYVFLPYIKPRDIELLLTNDSHKLKLVLANCPLFLNRDQAFEYSRFMGDNTAIVKLETPQSTIMSHNQTLMLRRRGLKKARVHGFYLLPQANEPIYYENPNFDTAWYNRITKITLPDFIYN